MPAKPGNAPGGGILTDSVESQDVEDNIRKGLVGCLFGMYGPEKVRKAESNDENPYLGVLIAAAMVRGYQGKDLLCQ